MPPRSSSESKAWVLGARHSWNMSADDGIAVGVFVLIFVVILTLDMVVKNRNNKKVGTHFGTPPVGTEEEALERHGD